jgi:hypothetical protein
LVVFFFLAPFFFALLLRFATLRGENSKRRRKELKRRKKLSSELEIEDFLNQRFKPRTNKDNNQKPKVTTKRKTSIIFINLIGIKKIYFN